MLTQRATQQSLRRLAVTQTPAFRFAAPVAIATGRVLGIQRRLAATQSISEATGSDSILAQQRRRRPVSPHLGIYRPQITWYPSMLNRLTGLTLSFSFYIFGAAYAVAPLVGWHLESAALAASVATWPLVVKFGLKLFYALPLVFHSLNGVRHLVWDTASMITNKQVAQTGWTVVGLSVVGALALCFI